jgi:hypothetical protein
MNLTLSYFGGEEMPFYLELIKSIKNVSSLGLKECKDFADNLRRNETQIIPINNIEYLEELQAAAKKSNVSIADFEMPKAAKPNIDKINLIGFTGGILEEMDFKNYLYSQFKLDYLQAAELMERLKKKEITSLPIDSAQVDSIAAALDKYKVFYFFHTNI